MHGLVSPRLAALLSRSLVGPLRGNDLALALASGEVAALSVGTDACETPSPCGFDASMVGYRS